MDAKRIQETYKTQAVLTASPVELEIMLLKESILCLKKVKITEHGFEKNEYFKKAQQCLLEIIPFFNREIIEGEAAALLYYYVNKLLIQANIEEKRAKF